MNIPDVLRSLISLHDAIGDAWCVEVRKGNGFGAEIIVSSTTVEAMHRHAEMFGITLGRALSVCGKSWWEDGEVVIDGIRVRVTGPHFPVVDIQTPEVA